MAIACLRETASCSFSGLCSPRCAFSPISASFLMSPASRNWLFGTTYFDFNLHPQSYYVRHKFVTLEKTPAQFWKEMAAALAAATLTIRLGLAWGNWMRRIRR